MLPRMLAVQLPHKPAAAPFGGGRWALESPVSQRWRLTRASVYKGAMEFTGEIATIQQRLAACHEMAARRHAVLQELAPRRGERVIEVGCGAGLLLREIGLALGPHGLAAGVDVSPDQIAAAARECMVTQDQGLWSIRTMDAGVCMRLSWRSTSGGIVPINATRPNGECQVILIEEVP